MDRKKVMDLIIDAIYQLDPFCMDRDNYDDLCKNATKILYFAKDELQKPDWISVEDELPPYEEEVLVCDKDKPGNICFTHRTLCGRNVRIDENCFIKRSVGHITHWRRIDKLDV